MRELIASLLIGLGTVAACQGDDLCEVYDDSEEVYTDTFEPYVDSEGCQWEGESQNTMRPVVDEDGNQVCGCGDWVEPTEE